MNGYLKTTELMGAMKALLAALPLDPEEVAPEPEKLFAEVQFYARPNLVKALEDLLLFDDRICLIVPSGETYRNAIQGNMAASLRTAEFHLLLADRDYGDRAAAVFGSEETAGVLAIKERVLEALTCVPVLPGAVLLPLQGEPLTLSKKEEEDTPGRECWVQSFECLAGGVRRVVPAGTRGELR